MTTYFFLRSKLTNNSQDFVVDVLGGVNAPGTSLDAYTQNPGGTDDQLWSLVQHSSGFVLIQSKMQSNEGKLVIDVAGGGTAPGTPVDVFTPNNGGSENQLWQFVPDPNNSGYYSIQSKLSVTGGPLVLEIQEGNTDPPPLVIAPFTGGDNQLWLPVWCPIAGDLFDPETLFSIVSKLTDSNANNLVIDVPAAGTSLDANIRNPVGSGNQLWKVKSGPAGSGYFLIQSNMPSGNVIDVLHGNNKPPALIDAYPANNGGAGSDDQFWQLVDAGSGWYFIQSKLADSNSNPLVIDVLGYNNQPGTLLYTQTTTGADEQLWRFVVAPPPPVTLYNFISFEFYTTNDDLSAGASAPLIGPTRGPSQLSANFTLDDGSTFNSQPVNVNAQGVLIGFPDNSDNTCVLPLPRPVTGTDLTQMTLTLIQGQITGPAGPDEWHVGAIAVKLLQNAPPAPDINNPPTNPSKTVLYVGGWGDIPPMPTMWVFNAASPQQVWNLPDLGQ